MADYSSFDNEQLIKIIAKQEKELKSKKYGLVWDSEREPEQVVLDCENNLPVLKRLKSKEIRTDDSEDNFLIEGDNYHALTVLNYTHKEKIDVIYIDPPYNTGAKDWKYNNNFVGEEDGFRHSKWLNMMEKRLRLAKELLCDNGIFVVSIDHNELFNLGLLCDKVFEEKNRLGVVAVVHKPEGRNQEKFFGTSHEYMFYYAKNKSKCNFRKIILDQKIQVTFDKSDKKGKYRLKNFIRLTDGKYSLRENKPHFFYPIYVSKDFKKFSIAKRDEFFEVLPITDKGIERTWKTTKETFIKRAEADDIIAIKNEDESISLFEKLREDQVIKTHWIEKEYHAYHFGTKLLENILGVKNFDFPKSLFLILDMLKITLNKDAIILDFFAGSGTTGHAVLELNKEDGGNRKFILCTNNENNICTEVTYPRVQKVIKGYKKNGNGEKVAGLKGNLQYLKTDLIKKSKNRDQVKINLTQKCTEMLCVKENIFNIEKEEKDYKIYSSNKKDRFLCVYYNFIDDTFNNFLAELKKLKGKKIIYMFSLDNKVEKNLFKNIKNKKIEAIPQSILDVYKQLVKMNIPIKPNIIFSDLNKAKIKIFIDKEKDDGARVLRVVLEKTIQKISQDNSINILNTRGKEEKISTLNDSLYKNKIITQVDWEENSTFLTIGNNASHGEYDDYDLKQVEKFYKHIQSLLNSYTV